MKSVRPERLNRDYACRECGGFLAVFGPEKNCEYVCVDCDTVYMGEDLEEQAPRIVVVKQENCLD